MGVLQLLLFLLLILALIFLVYFISFTKQYITMSQSHYPLVSQHFQVQWGGSRIGFTEVSGLQIAVDVIPYQGGSQPENTDLKMPGKKHYSNIVLKRGIMAGDNEFFQWINTIQLNQVERRDLVITLLNEHHEPVMVWKARNAFPVRYSGPELKTNGSFAAIEELEFAHDGLVVEAV